MEKGTREAKERTRHRHAAQARAALTTLHLQSSLQLEGSSGCFDIAVRPQQTTRRRCRGRGLSAANAENGTCLAWWEIMGGR